MPTVSRNRRISFFWLTSARLAAPATLARRGARRKQASAVDTAGSSAKSRGARDERLQQNGELVVRRRRLNKALVQALGLAARPDILKRQMRVVQRVAAGLEERPGAARLELHAHHVRLVRFDREGPSMR